MTRITVTDTDETFDKDGKLVEAVTVERDITAAVVEWSLHQRARDGIAKAEARTDKQRILALEAQVEVLTRLVVGRDLLDDA
jgi:hypothetical protein